MIGPTLLNKGNIHKMSIIAKKIAHIIIHTSTNR